MNFGNSYFKISQSVAACASVDDSDMADEHWVCLGQLKSNPREILSVLSATGITSKPIYATGSFVSETMTGHDGRNWADLAETRVGGKWVAGAALAHGAVVLAGSTVRAS